MSDCKKSMSTHRINSTYVGLAAVVAIFAGVAVAYADLESLLIRFAGGCRPSNTTSACTIRVSGTGTDLAGEGTLLQSSRTRNGRFRNVSNRVRSLDESGRATIRFKNQPLCFRVRSRAGVVSNVLCETRSGNGGSSSSSSSVSSGSSSSTSSNSSSSSSAGSSSSSSSSQNSSSSSSSSSDDDDDDHGGSGRK